MTTPTPTGWRAEGPCLDWALWSRGGRCFWVDTTSDAARLDSIDEQTTGQGFTSVREAIAYARNARATHVYDPRKRRWRALRAQVVMPARRIGKSVAAKQAAADSGGPYITPEYVAAARAAEDATQVKGLRLGLPFRDEI